MTGVTQALVLAGGKGTRLGSLTANTPKPLLNVGGKPFVAWLLEDLARFGFSEAILLVGPFAERFHADLGPGERHGLSLRLVPEPEPAGTAGALRHAAPSLESEFLLLNGDSWFDIDLGAFAAATPRGAAEGVVALRRVDDTGRYGRVRLEGDRIVNFAEKATGGPGLINAGIYHLRRSILDRIGEGMVSLERDVFPVAVSEGTLLGKVSDGRFIDIGIQDDLETARRHWLDWRRSPSA